MLQLNGTVFSLLAVIDQMAAWIVTTDDASESHYHYCTPVYKLLHSYRAAVIEHFSYIGIILVH